MIKGKRVTCATCKSEHNKRCNAKKGRPTVAINKRRRCDKYVLESTKVKEKQVLKTVKMGYKEREALRKQYKEELKKIKQMVGEQNTPKDPAHPLTGDLSRFTSTVGED